MTENEERRHLVTIGETEVEIVATGPKSVWCADVVSSKAQESARKVKRQVEELD